MSLSTVSSSSLLPLSPPPPLPLPPPPPPQPINYLIIMKSSMPHMLEDSIDVALCSRESASKFVLEFSSDVQETETGKHKEVETTQFNYNCSEDKG
jgi:hypothetical protein